VAVNFPQTPPDFIPLHRRSAIFGDYEPGFSPRTGTGPVIEGQVPARETFAFQSYPVKICPDAQNQTPWEP